MEESSRLVPVLVQPTSTVDLTEIPSRSHRTTPSPSGHGDSSAVMSQGTSSSIPMITESRCLKVTFNPESPEGLSCTSENTGSEVSSTYPQRHPTSTPPSKDDVLSVVIEKLTELVNDSERLQEESTPVCPGSKQTGSPRRGDPLYKCPKCPCLFALSARQVRSKEAVLCECCTDAEKRTGCKGKTVKGPLAGSRTCTSVEESKVSCELCSHIAVSYMGLLNHLLSQHKDTKICKCKFCDFFTTIEVRIREHVAVHHARRVYRCSMCPFVTDKVVGLRQHMKDHDKHRELLLKCSECGFSCQCENILRNHMWEHMPPASKTSAKPRKANSTDVTTTSTPGRKSDEKMSQPVSSPSLPTHSPDREQQYIFKCLLCGYLCDRLSTLKAHAWRHAGEQGCSYPVVDDDEYLKRGFSSTSPQTSHSVERCPAEVSSSITEAETSRESSVCRYDGFRGIDDTHEKVLAEPESEMSHGCCCGSTHSPNESSSCRCEGINILPSSVSHIKKLLLKKRQTNNQKSTKENDSDESSFEAEQDHRSICTSEAENQSDLESEIPEFKASDGIVSRPCEKFADNAKTAPDRGSKSNELDRPVFIIDPVDPLMLFLDVDMPIPEPASVVEAVTEQNSALETTDSVFIPPSNITRESGGTTDKVSAIDLSSTILPRRMLFSEEVREKSFPKCEREVPQLRYKEIPQAINTCRRLCTTDFCNEIEDNEKELAVTPSQVESVPSTLESSSPSKHGHVLHQTPPDEDPVSSSDLLPYSVKPQENPMKHLMKSGIWLRHIDKDRIETSAVVEHRNKQTPPRSESSSKSEQVSCQESTKEVTYEAAAQSKWKEGLLSNTGGSPHERIKKKPLNNNTEMEPLTGGQKRAAASTASNMSKEAKRICHRDEKSNTEMSLPITKEISCTVSTRDERERLGDPETKSAKHEMPTDLNSEDSIVKFFMSVVHGSDKPFQCKLCSKIFENYNSLKQHLKVHLVHNSFRCPLCKECFESLDNLRHHILEHYKELHRCSECSDFFPTKNELEVHMQSHAEPKECSTAVSTWEDYASHCETVHGNTGKAPVRCSHCGERFINTNTLLLHILTCPVRKMRACKECDFTAESTEGVQNHVRECHQKPKLYKCNLCDYKSSAKNGIKNHMKFHAKDRPYKCQQCSFTGAYPQSLRSHMRMHMQPDWRPDCLPSELPEQYKCKLCCYTCNYLPSLKSHMWRHASDPNYSYKGDQSTLPDLATSSNRSTGTTASDTYTTPPISNLACQSERSRVMCNIVTFCCQDCGFQSTDRVQLIEHMKTHLPSEILEMEKKHS